MAEKANRTRSPVQPPAGAVPDEWVEDFASTREARRLAEMAADRALLDRLMWSGYEGPEYDRIEERLAAYGHAVVYAWCRKNLIFDRCTERGWRIENQRRLTDDDAAELANETVTVALNGFRNEVLIPRIWDPSKGASLNTFFVGQCIKRFRDVYRRWWRENRPIPDHAHATPPAPGPEAIALDRLAAAEALAAIPDAVTRMVIELKADDMTNEEIAEACNITVSSVKSRLYRVQQQHRKDRGECRMNRSKTCSPAHRWGAQESADSPLAHHRRSCAQ